MSVHYNFNTIQDFASKVDTSLLVGLLAAGEDIKDLASQLAPYDPTNNEEHLKDSGQVTAIDVNTVQISFGDGLPDIRAIAVEFGTVFQEAQPFLTPAANQIDILKHVSDQLFNVIIR